MDKLIDVAIDCTSTLGELNSWLDGARTIAESQKPGEVVKK